MFIETSDFQLPAAASVPYFLSPDEIYSGLRGIVKWGEMWLKILQYAPNVQNISGTSYNLQSQSRLCQTLSPFMISVSVADNDFYLPSPYYCTSGNH